MSNKNRAFVLVVIVVISLFSLFTLAKAFVHNDEDDIFSYLPIVLMITGTPPPTPTVTNTPQATATVTPTNTPVPRHFDNCAFRTGSNATVAVPANVTINGDLELAVDDEIAIFNSDGTMCAGMTPWSGQNIAVTAWGDDTQTDEVDGLQAGEEMVFVIWDKSADQEMEVTQVTYVQGDGKYAADGIFVVSAFSLGG